jgi:MoaA/NifB/PqqE/SkfB family radical SAM enzyme
MDVSCFSEAADSSRAGGVVEWQVCGACNYDCRYCIQKRKNRRGVPDRATLDAIFEGLERLPGRWEVKMSGGEPFMQPGLIDLVKGLKSRNHFISVVTNFSASNEYLREFVQAAGERLRIVSASLHLEYASADAFRDKVLRLRTSLPPGASINVTAVARRENIDEIAAVRNSYLAFGIDFKVQPEKKGREVVPYTPAERRRIEAMGGHCGTGSVENSFQGRPCLAGAEYFIVDHEGEAYRCYPARRYRSERLGNLVQGDFSLMEGAAVCPYSYCSCTVPILRGLVR